MERKVVIRQIVKPVLDPRRFGQFEKKPLAPRPETLEGKTVALLDNCKEMAEPMLIAVKEYLEGHNINTKYYRSNSCCHAGAFPKGLLDEVAKADAAVLASAD